MVFGFELSTNFLTCDCLWMLISRVIWCLNGDWWLEVDVESPRPKNVWMLYSLYRLFTSPVSCMALGYALLHGESLGMVEKQNLWKVQIHVNFQTFSGSLRN